LSLRPRNKQPHRGYCIHHRSATKPFCRLRCVEMVGGMPIRPQRQRPCISLRIDRSSSLPEGTASMHASSLFTTQTTASRASPSSLFTHLQPYRDSSGRSVVHSNHIPCCCGAPDQPSKPQQSCRSKHQVQAAMMSKRSVLLLAGAVALVSHTQAASIRRRQANETITANETAINENVLRRNW